MSPDLYSIISVAAASVFSAVAVFSNSRGGKRALWLAWALASAVFVGIGFVDWRRQSSEETPLVAYIVGGIIPPLICAIVIRVLAVRGRSGVVQWACGAVAFYVSDLVALILSI
jgi:hypothetical protein